jgi:hypothetical protein
MEQSDPELYRQPLADDGDERSPWHHKNGTLWCPSKSALERQGHAGSSGEQNSIGCERKMTAERGTYNPESKRREVSRAPNHSS